ncbi:MAG: hypothetical protein HY426_01285 [Candidatus Levybacteria bacterium]|nr:hypothetical protein [Candidatus Levybacteria bacterium]
MQDSIALKEQEIAALQASASAASTSNEDGANAEGKFDKLRVTGSALIEGIVTVLDNLTVADLIVNSTSTFFGEVVFKDRVRFDAPVLFAKDTAGSAVVKKGTDKVVVEFERTYDYTPQVSSTLVAEGTPAQKQAHIAPILSYRI